MAAPMGSRSFAASWLRQAPTCRQTGSLLVEVGTGRAALEQEFPQLPFLWLDTAESEGEVFMLPASALRASRGR